MYYPMFKTTQEHLPLTLFVIVVCNDWNFKFHLIDILFMLINEIALRLPL